MRSRPKVKLLLSPAVLTPGDTLVAEAVLSATSDTPVDFVQVRFRGEIRVGVGQGKQRSVYEGFFFERQWTSEPTTLRTGEARFPVTFETPTNLPAPYIGADATIGYSVHVHVSIPWWPDRRSNFAVPVVLPPAPPPEPRSMTFATSHEGPTGKNAFMEASFDATQLALGDVLSGSVSLQNLHNRRVRGVSLSFVETESVTAPRRDTRTGKRFTLRVHDGPPPEGVAIPFRVRLPDHATVTFAATPVAPVGSLFIPISDATHIEMRADVAWGEDIVIRAPILVTRRATAPRVERGWIAPVGRERRVLIWRNAATKLGLITDEDAQRMTGQRGNVTVEVTAEHRENDFWLLAKLGWPNLGLDLDISERKWSDALAVNVIKCGVDRIDDRLAVHAREHIQTRVIVTSAMLNKLMAFDEVTMTDEGAVVALRGAPHVPERLEPFIANVLLAAVAIGEAVEEIPPPALFAADLPAWEALASRLRGRLERGRMWIHGAQVGTDSVEIGSMWERAGLHLGSIVEVAIDPPLGRVPVAPEDPSLSPIARDAWKELRDRSKNMTIDARAITIELQGRLSDPQTAMPVVELAVTLRRALTGTIAAGPFR